MDLLYANDKHGAYPPSWYAATTPQLDPFETLAGEHRADVCIIGAGYTGLSAALHLARSGRKVILLEAQRVGFGASGRNGGQLGSGQRPDQEALERMAGDDLARKLWAYGEDAKNLVKGLIKEHDIDCHLKPGVAWTASSDRDAANLRAYAELLSGKYGYDQVAPLDADACFELCPTPDYKGGLIDWGAAHLHPLAYALGLARAAKKAGVEIYEKSRVEELTHGSPAKIRTADGVVKADHVILACNGYLSGLAPSVTARVMPINNFIIATEPLGERTAEVLTKDVAVADGRFVVNYFRLSHDGRLLFGGGESYGYRFPQDIAAVVRKPMHIVFPHLKDVRVDYAWGGTLGITMKRFPYLARVAPNVLSASGYSGHGVGTATHAGQLMAKAIEGEADGFDTMSRIPTPSFPGGGLLRTPLLMLAMTWYALRDRIGF